MSLKYNNLTACLANSYYDLKNHDLKRLFFTATTGRSGTATLQKLFEAVPRCVSLHEPYPIMNDKVLEAASHGDEQYAERIYRLKKSVNIRRAASGNSYYLEANHLFIKTFIGQVVEDFGDRVTVIHLVRHPIDVARSLYQLGDFENEKGTQWWLDYRAPSNRIPISELLDKDKEFAHPFYKGLWYWFEIEARVADWRQRLPLAPFIRFETEWFNDREKTYQLLDQLEVEYQKEAIDAVIGEKENHRSDLKYKLDLEPTQALIMLQTFEDMLKEKGLYPAEVSTDITM